MSQEWDKERLLQIMMDVVKGSGSAEHESHDEEEFAKNFLPMTEYTRIFDPNIFLILGGRGAGKTHMFRLLSMPRVRQALAKHVGGRIPSFLENTIWFPGFAKQDKTFPPEDTIKKYVEEQENMDWRAFWIGLLTGALLKNDKIKFFVSDFIDVETVNILRERLPRVDKWHHRVMKELPDFTEALDNLDEYLKSEDQWLFVTYDELDRLVPYPLLAFPIRELLSFWLDRWRRWDRIRPKIFLRNDLFRTEFLGFTDSSKLNSHQIQLEWRVTSLYQMLVKRLANAEDYMKEYLDQVPGLLNKKVPLLGWIPSPEEDHYKLLMKQIIGEYMGANAQKGRSFTWIPNHLQDAGNRIAPRSFLNIFAIAAEYARNRGKMLTGDQLLNPQDLQAALMETSDRRIVELTFEEYPWIDALKVNLKGIDLPAPRATFLNAIRKTQFGETTPPVNEPKEILEYLSRLGIVEFRADGRVNVPEIYHYGFKMKRKGGIKRPK